VVFACFPGGEGVFGGVGVAAGAYYPGDEDRLIAGTFPDVPVHGGGVGVEAAHRLIAAKPGLSGEVRAGAERRGAYDDGQTMELRGLDVTLVDAAEDGTADRVAHQRGDPDVGVQRDVCLEHDARLDAAVG